MNTYKMEVLTSAAQNWSNEDLHGVVVSTVAGLTLVDRSSVRKVPGTTLRSILVTFSGLNDSEARETARQARASIPGSSDTTLAVKDGRRFRPVETD